ncbi:putative phage-related protein [Synechococcus sp. WH 8109]|uniref:hypothetical protein n=1 Tax=Synechococcus sp. WH 8109 TaxID=166314 RepID=UPI0003DFF387|nr:hypothetical protein [Synechococcus sp. WH 8109]AHF64082.1 putative phage-related protein [Synechococcus sp. WH 8109]
MPSCWELPLPLALQPSSVVPRLNAAGAMFLGGFVGDVSIPKRIGTASAYWLGADDSDSVNESPAPSAP